MRFGLVLTTYIWNEDRYRWARASYASLSRTRTDGLERPLLLAVVKHSGYNAAGLLSQYAFPQFEMQILPQPPNCRSNDGALGWAWDLLCRPTTGVTHMMLATDDWIYNPYWLLELRSLIERKPKARAWWVYRSAYEEIHKTLRVEPNAVLVRSINGAGCITPQEWKEWGWKWQQCPRETGKMGGLSFDLLHPRQRPGDRWVTPRSYISNIGLNGSCQRLEIPDFAVDFVGENYVPAAPDSRPSDRPDDHRQPEAAPVEFQPAARRGVSPAPPAPARVEPRAIRGWGSVPIGRPSP